MARLFLAVWPPGEVRAALGNLARDVALVAEGRPIDAAKIHLTLAFLGEIDAERAAVVHAAASAIRAPRFTLQLDRVGSFRRSRVAWAAAAAVPEALLSLQTALERSLRADGFILDERAFRPHITLARKIAKPLPPASIAPIEMCCEEFALVVSDLATGRYSTLESWPLA